MRMAWQVEADAAFSLRFEPIEGLESVITVCSLNPFAPLKPEDLLPLWQGSWTYEQVAASFLLHILRCALDRRTPLLDLENTPLTLAVDKRQRWARARVEAPLLREPIERWFGSLGTLKRLASLSGLADVRWTFQLRSPDRVDWERLRALAGPLGQPSTRRLYFNRDRLSRWPKRHFGLGFSCTVGYKHLQEIWKLKKRRLAHRLYLRRTQDGVFQLTYCDRQPLEPIVVAEVYPDGSCRLWDVGSSWADAAVECLKRRGCRWSYAYRPQLTPCIQLYCGGYDGVWLDHDGYLLDPPRLWRADFTQADLERSFLAEVLSMAREWDKPLPQVRVQRTFGLEDPETRMQGWAQRMGILSATQAQGQWLSLQFDAREQDYHTWLYLEEMAATSCPL